MARLGMLIDLRTCIGCHACSVACKAEFDVPLGVFRDTVREFLYDHVLPWAPVYCEQVAAAAALGFYRTTARLVAALLADEEPSGNANSRPG